MNDHGFAPIIQSLSIGMGISKEAPVRSIAIDSGASCNMTCEIQNTNPRGGADKDVQMEQIQYDMMIGVPSYRTGE